MSGIAVSLVGGARAGAEDGKKNLLEFRRGVQAFRDEDYNETVRRIQRALKRSGGAENDGQYVQAGDGLLEPTVYLPSYYLAAAELTIEPTWETCVEARKRWAKIKDKALEGKPSPIKTRIKRHLGELRSFCTEREAARIAADLEEESEETESVAAAPAPKSESPATESLSERREGADRPRR